MDAFVSLLLSPPKAVRQSYCEYNTTNYCLTSKSYKIFPKEVIDESGKSVTRFLPCHWLIIDTYDKETYDLYEKAIEAYLETTIDPIKVNWFGPKMVTVKTPKLEHEEDVQKANEARVKHQALVDLCTNDFRQNLKALGASTYIEWVDIHDWPSDCQLKEEWFDVKEEPNYEKCQINLTFHCETEIYKTLSQYKDKLKYSPENSGN